MKKILVVDDNKDLGRIIKRILDNEGYDTIFVDSGDACLETLDDFDKNPDLILLDIMMPGKPVSELVEEIGDIKIAYLSAVKISPKDKQIMMQKKNILDFIPKPFESKELVNKVKELVGE